MRLLAVRAAVVDDSSDSDSDVDVIPVNKHFRCAQKDKKTAKPVAEDFFSLDTAGGEEISDDEEMVEEEEKKEKKRFFLKDKQAVLEGGEKQQQTEKKTAEEEKQEKHVNEVLATSSIRPGFESSLGASAFTMSLRAKKRANKAEREKTTGQSWFDMPATEMTDDRRADLELLSMRATLDPKRFYRKNDRAVLPKYFQVGRVVEDKRDFYGGRLTKAERKKNMLDEMMKTDGDSFKKSQHKYEELRQAEKKKVHGAFQKNAPQNKTKMRMGKFDRKK
ncbi:hypothetical protein PFISCL1PPCAC_12192 [Pristionchus fissidentatus]|uniref:Fcf2 pre-rRNA processing C-terminal domain-containing protein n=1 Tax=Pristionchus fissidentatus TaxID=1538716 RepID=A0AAV5VSB0_9BILA|nr:hypothetical protein PFISCL1PPCAC_12192 [Pristionchus fissidentatus]